MKNPLLAPVLAYFARLRHPQLFALMAGLFFVDLVIPDFIPFVDELLLGLGTVFLGNWKRRRDPKEPLPPAR